MREWKDCDDCHELQGRDTAIARQGALLRQLVGELVKACDAGEARAADQIPGPSCVDCDHHTTDPEQCKGCSWWHDRTAKMVRAALREVGEPYYTEDPARESTKARPL